MLLLFETASGYAIFKINEKKVTSVADIAAAFEDTESAKKL